jgi:hypothetical protein
VWVWGVLSQQPRREVLRVLMVVPEQGLEQVWGHPADKEGLEGADEVGADVGVLAADCNLLKGALLEELAEIVGPRPKDYGSIGSIVEHGVEAKRFKRPD